MTSQVESAEAPKTLALIGGFIKPRSHAAHGSLHAAYMMCQALAEVGGYGELHVYADQRQLQKDTELVLPRTGARLLDKAQLVASGHRYAAIYVANGDHIGSVPHVLRPAHDWAPVICSIGTMHIPGQWSNLLVALASGAVRPSDGLIFKSRAARTLFAQVWEDWKGRLAPGVVFPELEAVIPNGVDVEGNKRSDVLRAETRRQLRLSPEDVVFLAFSRLSPGTKGDHLALLVRWKEVIARHPRALLILSGAVVDRPFLAELRSTARASGAADRVLILENPYEAMANARERLMSAADAFVHLTTGIEEVSSLVVHEALAHGLPVIATDWAGLGEVIREGTDGFLVPTTGVPAPLPLRASLFGASHVAQAAAAGQLVACDWRRFFAAVDHLTQPERRSMMAAAARENAEGRTLQMVARRYAEFFDRCSQHAKDGPRTKLRPLVELDRVLEIQGARPLALSSRLRLRDPAVAMLAAAAQSPDDARRIEVALAALGRGPLPTGDLVLALVRPEAGASNVPPEVALAWHGRLLVRLLNYGAIEIVDG